MGLLLIGCGYWGRNWANTLFPQEELAAICDGNTAAHADLTTAYAGVPICESLDDALALPGIEGAIVATPVGSHAAIASQCLNAGLPTLVEKPITTDVREAESLVALARDKNLTLAVGHICLFYPALERAKQLIAEGAIGDVLSVTCVRQKLGKIRNEENVWWSFAPHDLSIALDILNNPLLTVTGVAVRKDCGRSTIEDAVTASFETPTGQQVVVQVSWLHPNKQFETTIVGTRGICHVDHAGPGQTLTVTPIHLDKADHDVTLTYGGDNTTTEHWDNPIPPLEAQAKAFLTNIRTGQPIPNHGDNGLAVVRYLADVDAKLREGELVTA